MRPSLLLLLLFIWAHKVESIHSCESMFHAFLEPAPRTLTVNINTSSIHAISAGEQNKRLCSIALVTSRDNKVQVSVRRSSLPSPCSSHAVQVFEGPHLRTSWCENSTPSFRSLGSRLTIWYNTSSVVNGSFTIDYHAVLRSSADIPHCDFIPKIYNQTNHSPSDAWWLCRSYLYAAAFPRTLTATKNDIYTVYPFYQRLTREWRISSRRKSGVYVEIENNQNLSCSLGVIKVYNCEGRNNYRYLGSWCYGRNNTFRAASCLALRFNATSIPSGSNTIFSLTYRYPDRRPHETTTRNPWIPGVRQHGSLKTSQTASRSSRTGVIVGSVFGVVMLGLATAGALIAWRIYRRKNASPYQNPQITRPSEAHSSAISATKPVFSSVVYGQVKSPGNGKEGIEGTDTADTNDPLALQPNEHTTLCQPLVPTFPSGKVDGKDVSVPHNM